MYENEIYEIDKEKDVYYLGEVKDLDQLSGVIVCPECGNKATLRDYNWCFRTYSDYIAVENRLHKIHYRCRNCSTFFAEKVFYDRVS